MTLYKNVDICDLESILTKGVLSLDESSNNNWDDGRRANNPTDRVYLFQPVDGKENVFPRYGVALLEVEVKGAERSELIETDAHNYDYIEYTISKVEPDQIKRVIIPEIFKYRLDLPKSVEKSVFWCGFSTSVYGVNGLEPADEHVISCFSNTAPIEDSTFYNFFRGEDETRCIIDLYDIKYEF